MTNPALQLQKTRIRSDSSTVDTAPTYVDLGVNFTAFLALDTTYRARMLVQNTAAAAAASTTTKLQASINGAAFFDVTTSSTKVRAPGGTVGSADETTIATARLSGTGTYVAGRYGTDGTTSTGVTIGASGYSEFEFAFTIRSADAVVAGDKLQLKLVTVAGTTITATTVANEMVLRYLATNLSGGAPVLPTPTLSINATGVPVDEFGANLVGWYDATVSGSITQSGGAVSQWNNRTGSFPNVLQASSTLQPAYSANGLATGYPGITGDGTTDNLASSATVNLNVTKLAIFMVVKIPSSMPNSGRIFSMRSTAQTADWNNVNSVDFEHSTTGPVFQVYQNAQKSTVPAVYDTPILLEITWDGTNQTTRINGTAGTPVNASTANFNAAATVHLFSGYDGAAGSNLSNLTISEIIIAAGVDVTSGNRTNINNYLATKYNLAGFGAAFTAATLTGGSPVLPTPALNLNEKILGVQTNLILNSKLTGASVGATSANLPTTWQQVGGSQPGLGTFQSVTCEIAATGTEDGIPYIDLWIHGTNSGAEFVFQLYPMGTTNWLVATPNFKHTAWASVYGRVVSGNWTGFGYAGMATYDADVSQAYIQNINYVNLVSDLSSGAVTLGTERKTGALNSVGTNSSTVWIGANLNFDVQAAAAVDIKIRIGGPQVNWGVGASTYVATPDEPSPVLGPAVISIKQTLTAANLSGGTPVLGPGVETQSHVLTAANLTGGAPVLGAFRIVYNFIATTLSGGSPVLGTPAAAIVASVTYTQSDDASDLGGGSFHKKLVTSGAVGASPQLQNFGGILHYYFYTEPGIPGTSGDSGNFVVKIEVETVSIPGSATGAIQLHRVDSSGTIQSSSSATATQDFTTTGVKTFNLSNVNVGSWASGDRLLVDLIFTTVGFAQINIGVGDGTDNTVVAPTFTGNRLLTAANLSGGAPVLGAGALTQKHVLSPATLVSGSPVLGATPINQVHLIAQSPLTTGSPVLGPATITQKQVLNAATISGGVPVLGPGVETQQHVLTAATLSGGTPVLGPAAVFTLQPLTAANFVKTGPLFGAQNYIVDHNGDPLVDHNYSLIIDHTSEAISPVLFQGIIATALTGGAPVLGPATITQKQVLAAAGLTASSPVIPGLSAAYNLTAATLSGGVPVLGAGSFTQYHIITATNFATASPTLGQPTIVQMHGFIGGFTAGAPVLGAPALTQVQVLSPAALIVAPVVPTAVMTQTHLVLSAAILTVSSPVLGPATITQVQALATATLSSGAPVLGPGVETQVHVLTAATLVGGTPTLGAGVETQQHVLTAATLSGGAPQLSTPTVALEGQLLAVNLSSGNPVLGPAVLSQHQTIPGAVGVSPAPVLGAPSAAQNHHLDATGLTVGVVIPGFGLAQVVAFTAGGFTGGAPLLGAPSLAERYALTAAVMGVSSPQLSGASVSQGHRLTAATLIGSIELGAPVMGQHYVLDPAGLTVQPDQIPSVFFYEPHLLKKAVLLLV